MLGWGFLSSGTERKWQLLKTGTGRNSKILKCVGWTAWMWEKIKRVRFVSDAKVKWLKNEYATKWQEEGKKTQIGKDRWMHGERMADNFCLCASTWYNEFCEVIKI